MSGGGYASFGKLEPLAAAEAVTVSFDVRRADTATTGLSRLFWSVGKYGLDMIGDTLELRVMLADGTMSRHRTGPLDLDGDAWRSLAFTLDSATGAARLYLDGYEVLRRDGLDFAFDAQPARVTSVGGMATSTAYFDGAIDDVRIFARALDATRIAQIAAGSSPPVPLDPADDAAATEPGQTVTIGVLANDAGSGTLRLMAAGEGADGIVEIVDGALRYTPAAGFQGVDRFAYTVADRSGTLATAQVEVAVGTLVSDAASLMAALRAAKGGETILLAPGDYGRLSLDGRSMAFAAYAEEVTVRSLDPSAMAVITGLGLRSVKNLSFEKLVFDYVALDGAADATKPFEITASAAVSIRDSVFDGDLSRSLDPAKVGLGTGIGLSVRDSSQIELTGTAFHNWLRGAVFAATTDIEVTGNSVRDMRSDGMNFAGVQRVVIEGNSFRDFNTATATTDHPDMIQFWTNGTTLQTRDVTIRGNILDSGDGRWTQSIFMRNELVDSGRAGLEMYYANVVIEDNLIRNAHLHGITVGETLGLAIRNNTVAHSAATATGASVTVPRVNVDADSRDVTITGNLAHAFPDTGEGWVVADNMAIQRTDPAAANHYARLFTDGLGDGAPVERALRPTPGGALDSAGLGAGVARFDTRPDLPDGFIAAMTGRGLARESLSVAVGGVFDAAGAVDLTGASVAWDFGDGAAATGLSATHRYAAPGAYVVQARATLADGATVDLERTVEIESPVAARATFEAGFVDESPLENAVFASPGVVTAVSTYGEAVRLKGGTDQVRFDATSDFFNNDSYTVLVDFKKTTASGTGRLIYFAESFVVTVGADSIRADIVTDLGSGSIKAAAPSVYGTAWRNLALSFDGAVGAATLYIDGKKAGELTGLDGATQRGGASQDLYLGGPFGSSFDGLVDNFAFLRGALDAEGVEAAYRSERVEPGSVDYGLLSDLSDAFGPL